MKSAVAYMNLEFRVDVWAEDVNVGVTGPRVDYQKKVQRLGRSSMKMSEYKGGAEKRLGRRDVEGGKQATTHSGCRTKTGSRRRQSSTPSNSAYRSPQMRQ